MKKNVKTKIVKKMVKLQRKVEFKTKKDSLFPRSSISLINLTVKLNRTPVSNTAFDLRKQRRLNKCLKGQALIPPATYKYIEPNNSSFNKRPSKKTIHRLLKVKKVVPLSRQKNRMISLYVSDGLYYKWRKKERNNVNKHYTLLESTKIPVQKANLAILRDLGYTPRETKIRDNQIRLQVRNQRLDDGYNCKERRFNEQLIRKMLKDVA